MLDSLKSKMRRLGVGWYLPLVLLALPDCGLSTDVPPDNGFPGDNLPHTSAVMCDIPDLVKPQWECVPEGEAPMGVRIEDAAIALVSTQQSVYKLDYSNLASCKGNQPKRLKVVNLFPDGTAACLNCGQQLGPSKKYADTNAVCVAQCKDLFTHQTETPPPGGVDAFCAANARPSTNFPLHSCFEGACTQAGKYDQNFADPRRNVELVVWTDITPPGSTSANGTTLTRNAATSGNTLADFNAGAASTKAIFKNSGWVEFSTSMANVGAILGLTYSPCYPNCADQDGSYADIGYGLVLHEDGNVYVIENGVVSSAGSGPNGSFGSYVASNRFRIHVTDKLDGTATISYAKVDSGVCLPGNPCHDMVFYTSATVSKYPLRVDASIRQKDARLEGVTLVRVKEQQ